MRGPAYLLKPGEVITVQEVQGSDPTPEQIEAGARAVAALDDRDLAEGEDLQLARAVLDAVPLVPREELDAAQVLNAINRQLRDIYREALTALCDTIEQHANPDHDPIWDAVKQAREALSAESEGAR